MLHTYRCLAARRLVGPAIGEFRRSGCVVTDPLAGVRELAGWLSCGDAGAAATAGTVGMRGPGSLPAARSGRSNFASRSERGLMRALRRPARSRRRLMETFVTMDDHTTITARNDQVCRPALAPARNRARRALASDVPASPCARIICVDGREVGARATTIEGKAHTAGAPARRYATRASVRIPGTGLGGGPSPPGSPGRTIGSGGSGGGFGGELACPL
jgi:hypothetical protein